MGQFSESSTVYVATTGYSDYGQFQNANRPTTERELGNIYKAEK